MVQGSVCVIVWRAQECSESDDGPGICLVIVWRAQACSESDDGPGICLTQCLGQFLVRGGCNRLRGDILRAAVRSMAPRS
jgi:hypothetical protein